MTWYRLVTIDGVWTLRAEDMKQHINGSISRIENGRAIYTWAPSEWTTCFEVEAPTRTIFSTELLAIILIVALILCGKAAF